MTAPEPVPDIAAPLRRLIRGLGDDDRRALAAYLLTAPEIWDYVVTLTDIAERRGVPLGTVGTWAKRNPDWPKPLAAFGTSRLWWWPDMLAYLNRNHLPKWYKAMEPVMSPHVAVTMDATAWDDPAAREAAISTWLATLSRNSQRLFRGFIDDWSAWCDRHDVPFGNPQRRDASAYRTMLQRGGKLGPTAIGRRLNTLLRFYDFWIERDVVTENPFQAPRPQRRRRTDDAAAG